MVMKSPFGSLIFEGKTLGTKLCLAVHILGSELFGISLEMKSEMVVSSSKILLLLV